MCCCGLEHPAPYNSVISKMNPVSGSSWCGGAGHGWGFLQVICGQQCPRCSLRSASNIPYRLRTMMCLDSVVKAQQMRAACVRGSGGSDCTGCPHAWHCPFGVFAQIVRCRRSPLRDERQLCSTNPPLFQKKTQNCQRLETFHYMSASSPARAFAAGDRTHAQKRTRFS